MTTDGMSRVAPGVPAGGQFQASQHAESPVRLFDRSDGSFLKPSPSRTAEHCIGFWSTVEIPDEIIDQVEATYREHRIAEVHREMDRYMEEWDQEWANNNPEPKPREVEAWKARFKSERDIYWAQVHPVVAGARPELLGSYDSPQLVRAAQMYYHAPSRARFPEETERVLEHQIELFDEVLSVRAIERKYGLYQLHYAMESVFKNGTDAQILQSLANISEGINGVNNNLLDQRQDY